MMRVRIDLREGQSFSHDVGDGDEEQLVSLSKAEVKQALRGARIIRRSEGLIEFSKGGAKWRVAETGGQLMQIFGGGSVAATVADARRLL